MKKTLRETLNSQIKTYENKIKFFDEKIEKSLLQKDYQRVYYLQVRKEQLLDVLGDLKEL